MNNGQKLILAIIIIAIIITGGFFAFKSISKDKTSQTSTDSIKTGDIILSAENMESTITKYGEENKENDNGTYLSYAATYHIFKDGISNINSNDNSAMYKNIHGKTINQLVEEGKQLMKENNMTVEKYKESLNDLNNSAI